MRQDLEAVEQIRRDEVPSGMAMAHWAIAWCLKNPLVSAVIPGCKNAAQVRDNAAAADLVLECSSWVWSLCGGVGCRLSSSPFCSGSRTFSAAGSPWRWVFGGRLLMQTSLWGVLCGRPIVQLAHMVIMAPTQLD